MSDESTEGRKRPEIVEPTDVPVRYVDWIVTGGEYDGVVNVVLGTLDHTMAQSPDDLACVVVATKLRMSKPFAQRLHRALGDLLGEVSSAPAPPQTPPQNRMH